MVELIQMLEETQVPLVDQVAEEQAELQIMDLQEVNLHLQEDLVLQTLVDLTQVWVLLVEAEAEELTLTEDLVTPVVMVRHSIQLVQVHHQVILRMVVAEVVNKTELELVQEELEEAETETAKTVLLIQVVAVVLIMVLVNPMDQVDLEEL